MLLSDVPEMVSVDNKVYCLQYSESFSGDVFKISDNEPFYTLKTALNKIFSPTDLNYKHCLLTIDCNTVAICMISERTYKIFDSHSRDVYGIPDPFGKCVLIHVESLDNLSSFFQNTYPPNVTPFELKGVKSSLLNTVTQHESHGIPQNNILDKRETRLEKRRQRYKERKANETARVREERLARRREMRKSQSSEQREKTLLAKRQRLKQNIMSESSEVRKTRLLKKHQQKKQAVETETSQEREIRLSGKRQQNKQAVERETIEQKKRRLLARRRQTKEAVERETIEQKKRRLLARRRQTKEAVERETIEQKKRRLLAKRRQTKQAVERETIEQKKRRLLAKRRQTKQAVERETIEQKRRRLLAKRRQTKEAVERETAEQREVRLLNKRKQNKKAIHNESPRQRENRLTQKRQNAKKAYHNRLTKSQENCSTKVFKSNIKTLEQLITKFHNAVSNGPVYICTCCDQLWYKHSVCLADKIRASNPNAVKLLQNITSVNNAEWLCQTCMKHLKSGKVPPLAVVNGMKFPEKPTFFYLNELECRLIAPRLAFQKIMQAPRGKQLKINGNVVNVPADVINTINSELKIGQRECTTRTTGSKFSFFAYCACVRKTASA